MIYSLAPPLHTSLIRTLGLFAFLCSFFFSEESRAESLLMKPGEHEPYAFELQPRFVYRYTGLSRHYRLGVGPGFSASIPFVHNGPIKSINNNIGITFGLDVEFFRRSSCSFVLEGCPENGVTAFDIPVAAQWNFFFTKNLSAFAEVGLSVAILAGDQGGAVPVMFAPLTNVGGRAQWGMFGVVARLGYPSLSIAANLQF